MLFISLTPIFHISCYLVHKHWLKENNRYLLATQQCFITSYSWQ